MAKKASAARPKAVPKVYSYRRFSSEKQSKGDSEARQNVTSYQVAIEIAKDRGMEFDTELLQGIEALSAYTAKHIERGAFGRFLDAIEAGLVAPGSILVVDAIDRISRMKPLDGIDVVLRKIIGKGISIYTGGTEYNADNIQNTIYGLIAAITMAHQNSQQKSDRLKGTWIRKREANQDPEKRSRNRFTKWIPAWLGIKVRGSKKLIAPDLPEWQHAKKKEFDFEPLPGAKDAIKTMFKLRLKGMSPAAIAGIMNQTSKWKPAKHPAKRNTTQPFTEAYVRTILFNPAVIGHFRPHMRKDGKRVPAGEKLTDYYPPVVSEELFNRVQSKRQKPLRTGPTTHVRNLLRGLAFCPYCDAACYTVHKGKGRPTYHYCYNTRASREETGDGGKRQGASCQAPLFRTDELEELLLDNCKRIDPDMILSNPNELALQKMKVQADIEEAQAGIDARNKQLDTNFERLEDPKYRVYRSRYVEQGEKFEALNEEAEKQLVALRAEFDRLGFEASSLEKWQDGLAELKKAITQKDADKRKAARLRVNSHLGEIIARVEIFSRGKFDSQTCYPPEVTAWQELTKRRVESARRGAKISAAVKMAAAAVNDGDGIVAHFAGMLPRNAETKAFLKDLGKRRFGRDGRFVRVWFVTGHKLDLVPKGSIADGLRTIDVEEDGETVQKLTSVSPDLEYLYGRWQRRLARQKM